MSNYNLTSVFLGIIAMFVVGVTLMQLRVVLMPFVLAMLLSVIFKPVVLNLKARRFPTALSLLGVLIAFFLVLFLLGWFLSASIGALVQQIPDYEGRIVAYLDGVEAFVAAQAAQFNIEEADVGWSRAVSLSSVTSVVSTGIGTFITFLGTTFLVMLFMMFILAGSGDLAEKVRVAFPPAHAERIAVVVSNVDAQVRRYLVAKTLVSMATGLLTGIITASFGVDFPLVWAFLAFVLNYIPSFGSLVAVLCPVLLSLLQFDSVATTLVLMIILVATQATLGNIIEPRVMGFSLNLSPLFILVSLIFWGWLWGFWGMVLAVPLTATVKIVFENVEALRPFSVLMSGWTNAGSDEPPLPPNPGSLRAELAA
ncbi:MAG: AI-2E family transporter [Rhodothermales bacterium]|nr:AI-2E family transporter [Rhodothermales bacterium]MBO6781650.1 AI-2E family transporter [Rhodothermales bacterium]